MQKPTERHERIIAVLLRKIDEGNGAEAANARVTLAKLCKKYNLELEDVLRKTEVRIAREYPFSRAKDVVAQIILRYGYSKEIYYNNTRKYYFVDLTDAEHLEVTHALDILLPLYIKEVKKIRSIAMRAFLSKHDLYFKGEGEAPTARIGTEKEKTREEIERQRAELRQVAALAETMEEAQILKRLK